MIDAGKLARNTAAAEIHRERVLKSSEQSKQLLRQVQSLTQRLAETERMANLGSWELDAASGRFIWSDQAFAILAVDPQEFEATSEAFMALVHEDDRSEVRDAYQRSLITRQPYDVTHRLRTADGRIKWVTEKCIPEFDDVGQPLRSRGLMLDITDRKLAEDELRAANEKLHATLRAIPDLFFELSSDGRYVDFHAPRSDLLYAPAELLLGKKYTELLPADAAAVCTQALAEAAQTGRSTGAIYGLDLPQGRCWFELSVACHKPSKEAAEGQVSLRYLALVRDVTPRMLTEERLRIAATAFECQEGIAVMNDRFKYLKVNQAFTKLTGYPANEVEGSSSALFRSARYPAALFEAIRSQVLTEGQWQGQLWMPRKDKSERLAQVFVTAVKDASNCVTHFVTSLIDITDRHNEQQRRLAMEAAHREALVREVHHRIKNNLQGVAGLLRQAALRHPTLVDPINQTISQVQSVSVIHGLQAGTRDSAVNLADLIAAIAREVEQLWRHAIVVHIGVEDRHQRLAEKDAVPIALVLNELLVNAVKHSEEPEASVRISLQSGSGPDAVTLSIANRGHLPTGWLPTRQRQGGLQLVMALLPHEGAHLHFEQKDADVFAFLELRSPLLTPSGLTARHA